MPAGHIGRPPPLQRAMDPLHSQIIHSPNPNLHERVRTSTPSFPRPTDTPERPQSSFADELHSFIDDIASKVSNHTRVNQDIECFASQSIELGSEADSSRAADHSSRAIALKRLLEPLIKNVPGPNSEHPSGGFSLPPPPHISSTHLALRNVAGAYLVDAPSVSRPPPHFSVSKAPLGSPRSLSPLARTVERLSKAASKVAAPSDSVTAVSFAALPAMLQQPIDDIRRMASACGVEIQSAIDKLQTGMVLIMVEAFSDRERSSKTISKGTRETKVSRDRDGSKVVQRTSAALAAQEDFEESNLDMSQFCALPQIPSPAQAPPTVTRPTTQSSQCTPTPRSFDEGYGLAYDLPLQSLKFSSSHKLLSREAAAEVSFKKRMDGKFSLQSHPKSIASMMCASGVFDAPAAIWPSATLDSWPSNSPARVATSLGEGDVKFLQREISNGTAVGFSSTQPHVKVEMLRQCQRRPIPQLLQKIETDLDAALIARGLSVKKNLDSASSNLQQQREHAVRTPIFLDALVLLGAAFPTYRGLIMRIHGELAASFEHLDAEVKQRSDICEKFHQIQQIHAEDLRRERDRVLAAVDCDPASRHKGLQNSTSQQRDAALALQASNAEFMAQRRVKELEHALDLAKETVARLQEAVVYLRQQVDNKSTEGLQLQHAKAIAHLRSIIKESVHQDDHNALKQQLGKLQQENSQLLIQLNSQSKALHQSADALDPCSPKNGWKVSKKNFGTQTFMEHSVDTGRFSLLEIKDMILGVFPGLRSDIEQVMASLYGDQSAASVGSPPAFPSGSSPSLSPSCSTPSSPTQKLQSGAATLSFGSIAGRSDEGSAENANAAIQKMFGLVKQSVDHLALNASRSSSPGTPSGPRLKSIHSVSRMLKSRGQHSEDEDRQDIPPSEREMFAFFKTNGTGKNVPVHLRTNTKLVKNRFFSKRECENLVHQVWKGKDKQKNSSALDKFLLSFFIQQFGEETVVMENTYSLVYALKKFKYDPDCDLFLGCLDKVLPQDLRSVQPIITNEVLAACRKRDLRIHRETFGYLSLDDLLRALKDVKIFLYKSDEAFLALQDALALEAEDTSKIMYEKLFESDAAGDQCKFAETVREQSLIEYNELISDLQTSMIILSKNSRSRPILSKEEMIAQQARQDEFGEINSVDDACALVTMEMALSAWSSVDCRVPQKFAESVMLNAFQSRTGQKFPRTPVPIFEVVQELRKVPQQFARRCFSESAVHHKCNIFQVYITRYSKRDAAAAAPLSSALPSILDIKSMILKEKNSDEA